MVHALADANPAPSASEVQGLRRTAVVCALLIVATAVVDVVLMFFDHETLVPGTTTAAHWLELLRTHRLLSLRNLGLLNITNLLLEIPLFLALRDAHREAGRQLARVAFALLLVGGAVYIARNSVFALDALAGRYAVAPAEDKPALIAAAQALLAGGEDLTGGMFLGFFITEVAGILMSLGLLVGRTFARVTGVVGLVGFGALLVFNILAAFAPGLYDQALALGGLGGLVMIAWYVLLARALLRGPRQQGGMST